MSHDEDEVGYRRPPRRHQFKKGQSGNPRGRSKGSQNLSTLLTALLNRRVRITQDGKKKTILLSEALARQLVNGALAGDTRLIQLLLKYDYIDVPEQKVVWLHELDRYV